MTVSFLKKGAAAQAAVKQEEVKAELAAKNKTRRFWIPKDKEAEITFLDGELDADGALVVPMLYEHQLNINGKWTNWFPCTKDNEPCPICEGSTPGGGDRPYLAALLTVIDHSEYTAKDGTVHKDERRLYVVKRETLKQLQKYASKRKGLTGCRVSVSRSGEKSASVGDVFDFGEKLSLAELKAKYKDNAVPFKYEEVLVYNTAAQLREMGFGKGQPIPNTGPGSKIAVPAVEAEEM